MTATRNQSEGASQDLLNVLSSAFRRIGALEIDQGILAQVAADFFDGGYSQAFFESKSTSSPS